MAEFRGGDVVVVPMPTAPEMVVWALPGPAGEVPYADVEHLVDSEFDDRITTMTQLELDTEGHASAAAGSADDALGFAGEAESSASAAAGSASSAATSASEANTERNYSHTYAQQSRDARDVAEGHASTATTKADEASSSAGAAATARSRTQGFRDEAEDFRDSASTHASTASTKASQASSSASAADASAGAASASANTASGAASTASTQKDQAVTARDEALGFRNTAGTHADTATTQAGIASGAAEDAAGSASTASSKAVQTSEDALTLRQRIEAGAEEIGYTDDGEPYLLPPDQVEELRYRVDKSVGTRVFVGDVMIYGDTGDRDMRGLLPEGWSATTFRLRRVGQLVTISIVELKLDSSDGSTILRDFIPTDFRPYPRHMFNLVGVSYVQLNTAGGVSFVHPDGGNIQGVIAYHTHRDWPSSLPGTPA